MSVSFTFRPLDHSTWPDDGKDVYENSRFKASLAKTQRELADELRRIGVREAVIEADVPESGIRLDGQLRADCRTYSPRARLSFTHPAVGPLQYPCDTYAYLADNLRAIVKTLEAQRAMDRYGATRKHQQYAGWKALPGRVTALGAATPEAPMPLAEAVKTIVTHSGEPDSIKLREAIARTWGVYREHYRKAVKRVHPDVGGTPEQFNAVIRAKQTLDRHHGAEA